MLQPLAIAQNKLFLGRAEELRALRAVDASAEASLVVVYGRRRVGKTELVEQAYRERRPLKFEGIEGGDTARQLEQAVYQLSRYAGDGALQRLRFTRWLEFFDYLAPFVERGPWTLYFEEVQWLAAYGEEFVADLKHAWDNSLRRNPRLVVVLCGSAPAFMVGKVLRSRALYGRVAKEIRLAPFPFADTAAFVGARRSTFDLFEAQLALGGIPEYLKLVRTEGSTYLALCTHAFLPDAYFLNECERIFVSSLARNAHYRTIVEFLAARRGATRSEIAARCGVKAGGTLSSVLEDLELCGFIDGVVPYDKGPASKLIRYQIADPYLQFYYRFIAPQRRAIESGAFVGRATAALPLHHYQQWLGYVFERWCRTQHRHIAELLGFGAVRYRSGTWLKRDAADGFQFDLVFDRADHVLTLCEIKYTATPVGFGVAKEFAQRVEPLTVPRRTTVERVLISAAGADPELAAGGGFDRVLTLHELVGRA
jgi:hypothetical protein